ncbi:MAG: Zn-dependent alcohol dehydrogenase [Dehalococcoidales bacterium]|nr:Zn-dependent alcohol dehydrogenase [Dehalococcoidales bacterium]
MKKGRKIRAAVCYEVGKPLVMDEVYLEPPGKGEVTIRVAATSICHSDIHMIKGEHGPCPLPAVAGHETAGWVEEVGEGVTYVKPGDLVVYTLIPAACGHCYYCSIGEHDQCLNHRIVTRAPSKLVTQKGERIYQWYGTMATFAEYATGLETNLVKIPPDTPVDRAALLACGVIAGYGAVVNRAQVKPNRSVLVYGAGGVGLNAIQGALFVGAFPIIAIDVNDRKLELAKKFGATYTINAKKEPDVTKKVLELNDGRGVDYAIVAVAGIDILRQAFLMTAQAGMTVVVGHGYGEQMSAWMPVEFCRGRIIKGSAMGAVRPRIEIPRLLELHRHGRFKLDELISGHYSFDQLNEALASMEKGDVIRNVIMFDRK